MKSSSPKFCSMRGFLTFRILCYLLSGAKSGNEIAELIGKSSGKKPSPGTIYPALKELKKTRLITGRKRGKEIFYSLTPSGIKEAKLAYKYFRRCFSDILR